MTFLLDTNVVSELKKIGKGTADRNVVSWTDTVQLSDMFISVVTVEELEIGVLRMERRDGVQGKALRIWLEDQVLTAFAKRILPVDPPVARRSAHLTVPDVRPFRDTLIAATALVHGMTVVTRNDRDFRGTGVSILNPWSP
jgi:predicted nucleic acid-binding protein